MGVHSVCRMSRPVFGRPQNGSPIVTLGACLSGHPSSTVVIAICCNQRQHNTQFAVGILPSVRTLPLLSEQQDSVFQEISGLHCYNSGKIRCSFPSQWPQLPSSPIINPPTWGRGNSRRSAQKLSLFFPSPEVDFVSQPSWRCNLRGFKSASRLNHVKLYVPRASTRTKLLEPTLFLLSAAFSSVVRCLPKNSQSLPPIPFPIINPTEFRDPNGGALTPAFTLVSDRATFSRQLSPLCDPPLLSA